ncbi:MAG: arginine--tRNA ligase [Gemmataceae bacterium]|nr:arginine--tRNA ligase [Gemmataceae bacterium]
MNLLHHLRSLFEPVLTDLAPDKAKVPDLLAAIKPAGNPDHGDYQANFAMQLAKPLGRKPPDVAKAIVAKLPADAPVEPPTVAGPGFINLRLKTDFLAAAVRGIATHPKLGVESVARPKTVVIDYSSPNVAKPLHVGHLRSTIIGDALARILEFLGHRVVSDNHLGDWGTQFGMLIHGYRNFLDRAAYDRDPVRELARVYVEVRNAIKAAGGGTDDEEEAVNPVAEACRRETAKLHAGDPANLKLWEEFLPHSMAEVHAIYRRLGTRPFDAEHGESFYHTMLPAVVAHLLDKGLAGLSQGAVVIPNANGVIPMTPEETAKEDPPGIIQKKDGAFTYYTSDLATIKYRVDHYHADAMLYVVGVPQTLHFKTLFAQARRWGYDRVELEHVKFGSVLGEDRKVLSTRAGGAAELGGLIDRAVELGFQKYQESYDSRKAHGHDVPELTDETKQDIAAAIGVGAVKYADLSQNRTSDYVFSYDKMLATDGNTATYMQYAYARCRSIFRRENIDDARFHTDPPAVLLEHVAERALALQLLRFPEAVEAAAADYYPHLITGYLWDLAKSYSVFFENCPVLKAATPALRDSRLLLVDLVGRVIRQALALLGIRTVERM